MTIRAFAVPGKAKSDFICRAFLTGAPKSAVGSVFFGTEGQMNAFQKAKASGEPWYYADNAYFDKHRGIYFRVTKNALQVDPRGKVSNGERFAALKIDVKPMRENPSGNILLVPQSDNFMKSTIGVSYNWAESVMFRLAEWGIKNVCIHPWARDKLKRNATFSEMLPDTRLIITHSSAAAITALLEGVPAISTSDTAAAHWIGGPFTRENVLDPVRPSVEERRQFAEVLADNEFAMAEFRSGKAWSWLNF